MLLLRWLELRKYADKMQEWLGIPSIIIKERIYAIYGYLSGCHN